MKLSVIFCLLAMTAFCETIKDRSYSNKLREALRHGAWAKVVFKVIDECNNPVSNAYIKAGFWLNDQKGNAVKGYTDHDGFLIAEKKCNYDLNYWIEKNGFYVTQGQQIFSRSDARCIKDGRWQPYGLTNTVILKRKVNPMAMYVTTAYRHKPIPQQDEFVGFDLMAGDWIAPYGKGTVEDVSIKFEKKVTGSSGFQFRHLLTFAFPNQFDGAYRLKKDLFSDLSSVYVANTNGVYASKMVFEIDRLSGRIEKDTLLAKNEYLILRTRSKVDKDGKLKSAHYAKIYGPLYVSRSGLALTAYFNPNENDPNLEFDTTKNLNLEEKGGLSP